MARLSATAETITFVASNVIDCFARHEIPATVVKSPFRHTEAKH